jgi:hypothetical protein
VADRAGEFTTTFLPATEGFGALRPLVKSENRTKHRGPPIGGATDPDKLAESQQTGIPVPGLHSALFAPAASPTIRAGVLAMSAAVLDLMKK